MNERVEFESGGRRCVGVLRIPEDLRPGQRRGAIVYCAGMSLTKEVWLPDHAERLREAGWITLNFDYGYFGESEGEPRRRLIPQQQVEDTRRALDLICDLDMVDPSRVGLYGASLGAGVAVATAGVDDRVRCTVAVAGPMDLHRVWTAFDGFEGFSAKVDAARERFDTTGEASYISVARLLAGDPETVELLVQDEPNYERWSLEITFESLQDLFRFQPEAVVDRIAPRAVMFIAPEHDELIASVEMKSAYERAGEPKRLHILPGARHVDIYGKGAAFEPVVELSKSWFHEHMPAEETTG